MDCTSFCYLEGTSNQYCRFHAEALGSVPKKLPSHEEFLEEILEAIDRGVQNQEGDINKHVAHEVLQSIIKILPIQAHDTLLDGVVYGELLSYRGENVTNNL